MLAELAPNDEDAELLNYNWDFWARPKQSAPTGNWRIWMILAGRGFGKTRAITEWARFKAETMPGSRGAIVSSTAADARDIVVEGESGILAISPPWNRPKYEISKRRLTWPNGTIASLYTADEPDRLRGPQHHWALCDELCLIAGTQVTTSSGLRSIEDMRPGDMVMTRQGLRRVKHAWCSCPSAPVYRMSTSDGRELVGTAHHPVWVRGKGFTPLHLLQYGDTIEAWDMNIPSQNLVSSGAVSDGGLTAGITWIGAADSCIAPSIVSTTEKFQKGTTSTTKTKTRRITIRQILSHCRVQNTSSVIALKDGVHKTIQRAPKPDTRCGRNENRTRLLVRNVVLNLPLRARAQSSVLEDVEQRIDATRLIRLTTARPLNESAPIAEMSLPTSGQMPSIVLWNATTPISENLNDPASSAEKSSTQKTLEPNAVPKIVATSYVVSVNLLLESQPVYNLEVEGCHEYFANGILTHNCAWRYVQEAWDMLMMGLRLGDDPQCAIATTPRPIKIIRDLLKDPAVVATRGNTYENRGNLAAAFFSQIISRYAGTRLGRQEIDAELLDDVPGALWTHATLEANRVKRVPLLRRIVIAVDPAVTANKETSNETGILVAGIDENDEGYVLDDLSGIHDPLAWAKIVIAAYDKWHADAVVGEVNQGGDLVKSNVTSTAEIMFLKGERGNKYINFKDVRATKGKYTRAEPISSIDGQGHIHHVGMFAELEDQLCSWVPGEDSPDRLDARVWAFTELMLGASSMADGELVDAFRWQG